MIRLNDGFLLDDFHMSGTKLLEFEDILRLIDRYKKFAPDSTQIFDIKCYLTDYAIISLNRPEEQSDKICAYYIDPDNPLVNDHLRTIYLEKERLLNSEIKKKLFEDAEKVKFLFYDKEKKKFLYFSKKALKTLAQRLGLTLEALKELSVERDLFIARKMNSAKPVTLIKKCYNHTDKIFAIMSDKYIRMPLITVGDLYSIVMENKKYGKMVCKSWNVTHTEAKVSFSFPDYEKVLKESYDLPDPITPGIEYSISDIGEGSLRAKGYWETSAGSIVYGESVFKEHKGRDDIEKKIETMSKEIQEKILDNFIILPERLAELKKIRITSPAFNPDKSRDCSNNHKSVLAAFKYVLKKIDTTGCIGKKRSKVLEESTDFLVINSSKVYTAYDIVMDVFALPEILRNYFGKIGEGVLIKLREKVIPKAAFVDFTEMKQKIYMD